MTAAASPLCVAQGMGFIMKISPMLLAGVAMLVATGSQAQAAPLVGLYTFNNAANLGQDSSGNSNNLIAYGSGATYTANGATGGGLLLDGTSYLSTASQSVPGLFPTGNSAYTLAVSFKTISSNTLEGLIGWGSYGNDDTVNALRLDGSNGIRNYWWADDLGATTVTKVNDGNFHTAVASWDGITRSLYLDGTLLGTDQPGAAGVRTGNFAIGLTNAFNGTPTNIVSSNEHFTGTLDNVAIFNQAETPTQVSAAIAAVAAVPEPASWAMMIVGMGAVGGTLRRRKVATRVSYAA